VASKIHGNSISSTLLNMYGFKCSTTSGSVRRPLQIECKSNVKFIESSRAPQIKDLTEALFITANVDLHGTSSIQPLG